METAADVTADERAMERLLAHQSVFADDARPPVAERLEAALGEHLARLLTSALVPRGYCGRSGRLGT